MATAFAAFNVAFEELRLASIRHVAASLRSPVLYRPADEALEVFAFAAIDGHGVVGRGASLFEDLDVPAGLLGCARQDVQEIFA